MKTSKLQDKIRRLDEGLELYQELHREEVRKLKMTCEHRYDDGSCAVIFQEDGQAVCAICKRWFDG